MPFCGKLFRFTVDMYQLEVTAAIFCYCSLPNATRAEKQAPYISQDTTVMYSLHSTSPLTLAHEDSETARTSYQTSSCDMGNMQWAIQREEKEVHSQI